MKPVERKRINIAFLTSLDPQNRRSWSGTVYHTAQALEKHCGDITYIGPLDASKEKLLGKSLHAGSRLLFRKNYAYNHTFMVARRYAKVAQRMLANRAFDIIVTVAGATDIAFLETNIPVVLIEDATFSLLHEYHQHFSHLLKRSAAQVDAMQGLGIRKSSLLLYPSEWAARSAVEVYHADPRSVHVVPFGANFEQSPPREILLRREKSDRCRLLFIGVNWERKGGDIAFETLLHLEKLGIDAELTVCGCVPPANFSHKRLNVIPFLDKNDEAQRKALENLYLASDFLLFPTRNDCYGIVVCEANAFGLPAIASRTGGVPGVVTDGENGFLLPYHARGKEYAELIAEIYRDERRYKELVQTCRQAFDQRLNWDVWGAHVTRLIDEMLGCTTQEEHEVEMC